MATPTIRVTRRCDAVIDLRDLLIIVLTSTMADRARAIMAATNKDVLRTDTQALRH